MGPDELDDLLESIKSDAKRESALALYEGKREDDLVDEEVDGRILSLLGLDDVFDIDYGTYISLLKERLVASRNFDKKLSSEEDELLVSEFKRVKGKVGRFKIKKKKITSDNIGVTGPIRVSSSKFLLAGKAIVPEFSSGEDSNLILSIQKALDNILKNLSLQNKEKKKTSEDDRKKSEDARRRKKEGELEKPLTQLKSLAKKIIAPAQGILDRIFKFIKFTLLGYAFNQLIKWFSDPKNANKVKVLGRFLKDWWPALAIAYGLFATPFGKFIRVTLGMLRGFIPQIARFLVANPWIAGAALMTTAGVVGIQQRKQKEELLFPEKDKQGKPIQKTTQQRVSEIQKKAMIQIGDPMGAGPIGNAYKGGGLVKRGSFKRKSFFGGGQINVSDIAYEDGGGIHKDSGLKITGAGSDTQLIAAAPGEVVMSKKAVDTYGSNFFLGLNRKAGASGVPRMVNNIQLAAGGGLIKKKVQSFQGGGMVGGFNRPISIKNSINNARQTIINRQAERNGNINKNVNNTRPWWERMNPFSRKKSFSNSLPGPNNIEAYPRMPGFNRDSFNKGLIKELNEPWKPYVKPGTSSPLLTQLNNSYSPVNISSSNISSSRPKVSPPGPPVIYTKTTYTVLPPIKSQSKAPAVARGSKLPEFVISSDNDTRSKIASTLGIADLVGVS